MRPVLTADEMRAVDRRAITELGIPGSALMEAAGRGAAEAMVDFLGPARPRSRTRRIAILCGKGGNGGDGFVVARWLRRRGFTPSVFLATAPREVTGDAGEKLAALRRAGIRPTVVDDPDVVAPALAAADVVVDALLGTGARGAPSGLPARLIEIINASGRPVVALDIPSGLPADGEAPPGPVVRATLTPTFAAPKRGLVMGPGVALAGTVRVVDIGVPAAEVARGITTFLLERRDVAAHVPPRPRETHKGHYGHLLVVAGSLGKTGAAALAGRAAMRSGAGLVTVATAASQQPVVAGLLLEAMTEALAETAAHTVALDAGARIAALAETRDAVALGPGLGLEAETQELARVLVRDLRKPMVVDADALTALAADREPAPAAGPRCLTPHPGEMARLLGASPADVQRDRLAAARTLATGRQVWAVLKGATSIVASPDGRLVLNPTGNPGMASGGTGDVLTGMVGALLGRGLAPDAALTTAVYLHGLAGDLAAGRVGEEALVASDLIVALPDAFAALTRGA